MIGASFDDHIPNALTVHQPHAGHDERAKLTDFGLSKSQDLATHTGGSTSANAAGTPNFMSPELLMENVFNEKGDVYAYGILSWEILTCKHPYEGLNPAQITAQVCVKRTRPSVPQEAPDDLVALMQVRAS